MLVSAHKAARERPSLTCYLKCYHSPSLMAQYQIPTHKSRTRLTATPSPRQDQSLPVALLRASGWPLGQATVSQGWDRSEFPRAASQGTCFPAGTPGNCRFTEGGLSAEASTALLGGRLLRFLRTKPLSSPRGGETAPAPSPARRSQDYWEIRASPGAPRRCCACGGDSSVARGCTPGPLGLSSGSSPRA